MTNCMQSSKLSKIVWYVMSICYKSSWLPAFISDHHIVKLSPLRSNPFLAETSSEYNKANQRYFSSQISAQCMYA